MQFYENYVRLCSYSGKSPSYVAQEVGIQKSTVSRWAKGSVPRYTTLLRIADYFGVSIAELVGANEENEKQVAKELGISLYVLNEKREREDSDDPKTEESGLEAALEALRNQPGRRALLSATKGMTEAQVLRMADWLSDLTGGDKD